MIDADTLTALQSIADSLKRLADKFAPIEAQRERLPATLTKAIYNREERERKKIGENLRSKEPQP
jgi:hypothetical protein